MMTFTEAVMELDERRSDRGIVGSGVDYIHDTADAIVQNFKWWFTLEVLGGALHVGANMALASGPIMGVVGAVLGAGVGAVAAGVTYLLTKLVRYFTARDSNLADLLTRGGLDPEMVSGPLQEALEEIDIDVRRARSDSRYLEEKMRELRDVLAKKLFYVKEIPIRVGPR